MCISYGSKLASPSRPRLHTAWLSLNLNNRKKYFKTNFFPCSAVPGALLFRTLAWFFIIAVMYERFETCWRCVAFCCLLPVLFSYKRSLSASHTHYERRVIKHLAKCRYFIYAPIDDAKYKKVKFQ